MSLRQNPGGEGEKNHPSKFRQNQEKCNDIAFDKILSKQNIECVFCELSSTINHSKIFELISQLYKCCPLIVNSRSKTSIDRTLPESSSYSHCLFWFSPSAPRFSLHSINNLSKLTFLTFKLPVLGGFLFERRPSVPYFERQLLARALHRGKSPSCGQHVAHSKDDWSSCPQGLWGVLWWTDVPYLSNKNSWRYFQQNINHDISTFSWPNITWEFRCVLYFALKGKVLRKFLCSENLM